MYKYLYVDANTFFHRLDPRAKMLIVLAHYLLLALLVRQLYLMIAVAIETLVLAGLSQSLGNVMRFRAVLLVIFISSQLSFLFIARGATPLVGPVPLEPLLQGLSTAIRAGAGIVISVVLLSTTRNEELAQGLIRMGLPYRAVFAFSSSLRMAPYLIGMTGTVFEAQKTRGLDLDSGGPVRRFRRFLAVLAPGFLSSMRSVDQFAMASEGRGFGYQQTRGSYLQLQFATGDFVAIGATVVSIIVGIFIAITGWGTAFNL